MADNKLEKERKQWELERDVSQVKDRLKEINTELSQMKDLKYIPSQWEEVKNWVEKINEKMDTFATQKDLKETKEEIEEKYAPWLKIIVGVITAIVILVFTAIAKLVIK